MKTLDFLGGETPGGAASDLWSEMVTARLVLHVRLRQAKAIHIYTGI